MRESGFVILKRGGRKERIGPGKQRGRGAKCPEPRSLGPQCSGPRCLGP